MKASFFFGACYLLIIPFAVQAQIQKEPVSYSKIKIVYEMRSNIDYNERGIYADTVLLKRILPTTKFIKIQSPVNPTEIIGFIAIKNLAKEEKHFVARFIFNSTQLVNIAYDAKKDKMTMFGTVGYDREKTQRLNVFFDSDFKRMRFLSNTFRYKENFQYKRSVGGYSRKGNIHDNQIKWLKNNPNMGTYQDQGHGINYTNLVYINTSLNKNISPVLRFGNCEFGIEKIISYYHTLDLHSVTYQ